jgi:urease gamma subunit
MNIVDLLNTLPGTILLIIEQFLQEAARDGKTPEQLLESAKIKIAANEQKAADLLERLRG